MKELDRKLNNAFDIINFRAYVYFYYFPDLDSFVIISSFSRNVNRFCDFSFVKIKKSRYNLSFSLIFSFFLIFSYGFLFREFQKFFHIIPKQAYIVASKQKRRYKMATTYKPEGHLIITPENRECICSQQGLERAMTLGRILEAPVSLCDSRMRLHVDLYGIKGIIEKEEVSYSPIGEPVKDIAVITRVGKPVCFKVIGFENFQKLFDPKSNIFSFFWGALGNTVIMWVCNFIPQIGMALLLASWFTDTRLRLKFQGGFKVLIFMPNIITAATIGMLFMSLFGYPVAPVNTLLQQFGIASAPTDYFRSVAISRGLISFLQWWMWYGNTMIIMIAGILGINPSLFEASLVDGCSSRQTFWKITLPLIKPILLYNLVTSLVGGLTMFDIPHMMTQGNPNDTTNTVARFIYQQGFEAPNNFNMASAASVVLFGIIVICSLILSALMKDRDAKPHKIK